MQRLVIQSLAIQQRLFLFSETVWVVAMVSDRFRARYDALALPRPPKSLQQHFASTNYRVLPGAARQ
jgi:hypothetical protein